SCHTQVQGNPHRPLTSLWSRSRGQSPAIAADPWRAIPQRREAKGIGSPAPELVLPAETIPANFASAQEQCQRPASRRTSGRLSKPEVQALSRRQMWPPGTIKKCSQGCERLGPHEPTDQAGRTSEATAG